jgi:endonuclease YncB( thermonuclease family)
MKKLLTALLMCLTFATMAQTIQPKPFKATIYISSVYDGDSYYGTINGVFTEMRHINFDAPEDTNRRTQKAAQPFAKATKDSVKQLILKKTFKGYVYGRDKYNRNLIALKVKRGKYWKQLYYVAVKEGWAWTYTKYQKDSSQRQMLLKVQQIAKRRNRGLWQYPNPVYPETWRGSH